MPRFLQVLVYGFLLCVMVSRAQAANCFFSDLQWSRDEESVYFLAGSQENSQTLRYDFSTGQVSCLDPQAARPVWAPRSERILFSDPFGVYELRPDRDGLQPNAKMVLFLPAISNYFVRAYGEDSRGNLLFWVYDRQQGKHMLFTVDARGIRMLPGRYSGVEALRAWQDRDRAEPFQEVGGRFVRSNCVRRPHERDQLCMEIIPRADMNISPFFRITLGAPGGIEVVQNRCAPTSISPSADSTQVLLGVYEHVDDEGRSETLTAWLVNWEEAVRVYETLLPAPTPVRQHHSSWALWQAEKVMWMDAVGQLWTIDSMVQSAEPLMELPSKTNRLAVTRLVVLETEDPSQATETAERLARRGFQAAIRRAGLMYEVQSGATQEPREVAERLRRLQVAGFSGALSRDGSVSEVALTLNHLQVSNSSGNTVFVRHVKTPKGVCSELWFVNRGDEPTLLVSTLSEYVPLGL